VAERGGDGFDERLDASAGWELAGVLADLDVLTLSAHDLVTTAQACQKLIARAEALQTRVFAELAARPEYTTCSCPADVVHTHRAVEPAGDEVSLTLRRSPLPSSTGD
jgi:hypothetical protein